MNEFCVGQVRSTEVNLKAGHFSLFELDLFPVADANCGHDGLHILAQLGMRMDSNVVRSFAGSSSFVGLAGECAEQAHDLNVILLRMLLGKTL